MTDSTANDSRLVSPAIDFRPTDPTSVLPAGGDSSDDAQVGADIRNTETDTVLPRASYEENCQDGKDGDGDGQTDCDDIECWHTKPCCGDTGDLKLVQFLEMGESPRFLVSSDGLWFVVVPNSYDFGWTTKHYTSAAQKELKMMVFARQLIDGDLSLHVEIVYPPATTWDFRPGHLVALPVDGPLYVAGSRVVPDGCEDVAVCGEKWQFALGAFHLDDEMPEQKPQPYVYIPEEDPGLADALSTWLTLGVWEWGPDWVVPLDGSELYLLTLNGILSYAREPLTGHPSLVGAVELASPLHWRSVVFSPHADYLYIFSQHFYSGGEASNSSLLQVARKGTGDELPLVLVDSPFHPHYPDEWGDLEGPGLEGFPFPSAPPLMSMDGRHLYLASNSSDGEYVALCRTSADGHLWEQGGIGDQPGLAGECGNGALFPGSDGGTVYFLNHISDRVCVFGRDPGSAALTKTGEFSLGEHLIDVPKFYSWGLEHERRFAVSPDGRFLYVSVENGIAVLATDTCVSPCVETCVSENCQCGTVCGEECGACLPGEVCTDGCQCMYDSCGPW